MAEKFQMYEEATQRIGRIADPSERAFVQYGFTTALTGRGIAEGREPASPIDLDYLCEVLQAMYANREALTKILAGKHEDLRWFDDGEE